MKCLFRISTKPEMYYTWGIPGDDYETPGIADRLLRECGIVPGSDTDFLIPVSHIKEAVAVLRLNGIESEFEEPK